MNTFVHSVAFGCLELNDIWDHSPEGDEERLLWIMWSKDFIITHIYSSQIFFFFRDLYVLENF